MSKQKHKNGLSFPHRVENPCAKVCDLTFLYGLCAKTRFFIKKPFLHLFFLFQKMQMIGEIFVFLSFFKLLTRRLR